MGQRVTRASRMGVLGLIALTYATSPVLVHASTTARAMLADTSGQPSLTVIATGLNNPRGLRFGPDGALYVAEAGKGGKGPACGLVLDSQTDKACYGPSGSITRLALSPSGNVLSNHRIYTGLPSYASMTGTVGEGPADVAFMGKDLHPYVIMQTMGITPTLPPPTGLGAKYGQKFGDLLHMSANGKPTIAAVVWRYQTSHIPYVWPDRQPNPDSDPYNLVTDAKTHSVYVVDAAANDLVRVSKSGAISTVAIFKDYTITGLTKPCSRSFPLCFQSVPDSLTKGPDGALYVGEFDGSGSLPGQANIFRIVPGSKVITKPAIYRSGFAAISGMAFAPDGSLYVSEMYEGGLGKGTNGSLVHVATDGTHTALFTGLDNGLYLPGGLAVSPDGKYAYMTNYSQCSSNSTGPCAPHGGEVVRVSLAASASAQNTATPATPSGGDNSALPIVIIVVVVIVGVVAFMMRRPKKR